MKILASTVCVASLVAISKPALAITDVCIFTNYHDLVHYVTLTSAEASDPDVEAYRINSDLYDGATGSWIHGAHRWAAKNGGAGMQDYYHRVDWAWEGDWILGDSFTLDDWNGGWYDAEATGTIVSYGGGCSAFWPY